MQRLLIVNWPLGAPVKTLRKCRKRHVEKLNEADPEEITVSDSATHDLTFVICLPASSLAALGPMAFIQGNGFHQAIIKCL